MNAEYFAKRSDAASLAVVTAHALLVVSPIYLAAAFGPAWHTPLFLLFFGLSMNGILNLMHECAHILVFKERRWSDRLGRWFIAPFVFADFDGYRDRHWAHHKHIGEAGDTKDTYLIDIRGAGLLRAFLRCILMIEAASKFLRQAPRDGSRPASNAWLLRVTLLQALFGSSLLATAWIATQGNWRNTIVNTAVAYGFVYLYGLMSVTVFMAMLRAIAEHQQFPDGSAQTGHAALRNFTCGPLSRYLMGAYGFGEHYTHHRVPGIPYYLLPAATDDLAAAEPSMRPGKDYFAVLADIVLSRPGAAVSKEPS
jgi:fatty acid desaturase